MAVRLVSCPIGSLATILVFKTDFGNFAGFSKLHVLISFQYISECMLDMVDNLID